MTEELAKYERQAHSPVVLMMEAIEKGLDLDKVQKMMELQESWERREAEKAYYKAMANFKAKAPDIEKDKRVHFESQKGVTNYHHASLANITGILNKALGEHDLNATWKTEQGEGGKITVTCYIKHAMGYGESTSLFASPDLTGNKNNIQAIGSTISYLERYTLLALTGLATKEQDTDGVIEEIEYVSEKQIEEMAKLIKEKDVDVEAFLRYIKVDGDNIDKIPANMFGKAITALKEKKTPKKEPEPTLKEKLTNEINEYLKAHNAEKPEHFRAVLIEVTEFEKKDKEGNPTGKMDFIDDINDKRFSDAWMRTAIGNLRAKIKEENK